MKVLEAIRVLDRNGRFAPKVLDADGAEIRVGDTVWHVHDLDKLTVTNPNNGENLSVSCTGEDGVEYCCYPNGLTHRAPVLASDGRPLREGETVWYVPTPNEAKECKVEELPEREKGERAVGLRALDGTVISCPTGYVTHERPVADTWERIEEDADALVDAEINGEGSCNAANSYCNRRGLGEGTSFVLMARDLVRRAKALAGVSE